MKKSPVKQSAATALLLVAVPFLFFHCAGSGDGAAVIIDGSDAGGDGAVVPGDGAPGDGARAEGGGEDDGGDGGKTVGGPACTGDAAAFTTFDKRCGGSDTACKFGLHKVDCCGSYIAIGYGRAEQPAFDTAEADWSMQCPACGCVAKPTVAEDGTTGDFLNVKVSCVIANPGDLGQCRTHF